MKTTAKRASATVKRITAATAALLILGEGGLLAINSPTEANLSSLAAVVQPLNDLPNAAHVALPIATVDVRMPHQTGTVRKISAGDARSFQKALNAATCGDTIVLQAGSVYRGNFTVPNIGSCSGWVVVESSSAADLPSERRVDPSSVSNMATLSSTALAPVVQFAATGIHNLRFIGLEIACGTGVCDSPRDLSNGLVEIDGGLPSSVAATPNEIIIDRCYIHGTPTQNIRRGVSANGTNIAVVDSYISEIHEAGAATAGDSQAIEDWNGAGPLLIQNNYLEAASENIMFGGAAEAIPGLIPSDITIVGNYFYKDPSWRGKAAPYNWVIKDSLEFKNAQRVRVDGNVFSYCWLQAQAGELIEVTPRALEGDGHETAADLTFTDNLLEHAAIGFIIGDSDNNHVPTSQPPQRISIQNNVLTDISASSWGNGAGGWSLLIEDIAGGPNPDNRTNWRDLIIDRNDLFSDSRSNCGIFTSGGQGPSAVAAGPLRFTNNFMVGDLCGQGISPGERSIDFYYRDLTWNENALVGARGKGYSKGTAFVSETKALKFKRQPSAGAVGTTYQLGLSGPFPSAGQDGKDVGLSDWTRWKAATTAAMTGHHE